MEQDIRLIRKEALLRLISVSNSTLFRWERDGTFPPRIKIGHKAVAWRIADVENWLARNSDVSASKRDDGQRSLEVVP